MRDLLVAFITAAILLSLLRSGSLPWELVTKDEISQQISTAVTAAVTAATTAQAAKARTGEWMWSPDRQRALDKPPEAVGRGHSPTSTTGS